MPGCRRTRNHISHDTFQMCRPQELGTWNLELMLPSYAQNSCAHLQITRLWLSQHHHSITELTWKSMLAGCKLGHPMTPSINERSISFLCVGNHRGGRRDPNHPCLHLTISFMGRQSGSVSYFLWKRQLQKSSLYGAFHALTRPTTSHKMWSRYPRQPLSELLSLESLK